MDYKARYKMANQVAEEFFHRVRKKLPSSVSRRMYLDDARQEVALRVAEKSSASDDRMSEPAYLRVVVWRALVDWLRRELEILFSEEQFPLPADFEDSADGAGAEVVDPRPARELEREVICDRAAEVQSRLNLLTPRQNEALALRLEGHTLSRVGELLGVSHQYVARSLSTAAATIRSSLGVA